MSVFSGPAAELGWGVARIGSSAAYHDGDHVLHGHAEVIAAAQSGAGAAVYYEGFGRPHNRLHRATRWLEAANVWRRTMVEAPPACPDNPHAGLFQVNHACTLSNRMIACTVW